MIAGVSTACFYPELLETAFCRLARSEIRSVEIFFNTFSELEPRYVRLLRSYADSFGVSVPSVHPFTSGYEAMLLFSGYERRTRDGLRFYEKYFKAMNILGARFFVLHGYCSTVPIADEAYFEVFSRLAALGREFGVTVLQENVRSYKSASFDFLRRMLDALGDDYAMVLDIKQAIRCGCDPFDYLSTFGNSIRHVHVSDNGPKGDCLTIGKGTFPLDSFVRELKSLGFDGSLMLELYSHNFKDYSEIIESYRLIADTIKKAGA